MIQLGSLVPLVVITKGVEPLRLNCGSTKTMSGKWNKIPSMEILSQKHIRTAMHELAQKSIK